MARQHAMWSVLLVDDNADLRRLMVLALERTESFEVVGQAGDGIEAVELGEALQPDLVILDLNMPIMNGFDALPLIRTASPRSRVVVFSGIAEEVAPGEITGAAGYLVKGTDVDELIDSLVEVMRRPSSMDQPPSP